MRDRVSYNKDVSQAHECKYRSKAPPCKFVFQALSLSLSLTIAHIKKNASVSLSPQDNPSPKNNQQQQNLSTKFSEPVKCSNPLLESKPSYTKNVVLVTSSPLSLSLSLVKGKVRL
jgi:hypothetical protein